MCIRVFVYSCTLSMAFDSNLFTLPPPSSGRSNERNRSRSIRSIPEGIRGEYEYDLKKKKERRKGKKKTMISRERSFLVEGGKGGGEGREGGVTLAPLVARNIIDRLINNLNSIVTSSDIDFNTRGEGKRGGKEGRGEGNTGRSWDTDELNTIRKYESFFSFSSFYK